jgi:quercetin dioxygenase-like cupin family protein
MSRYASLSELEKGGNVMLKKLFVVAALATAVFAGAALAQSAPPPIKRIPLQKFDVPGAGYETVMGIAEIAPNVDIGRHSHPGVESGYVLEGDGILVVEGKPDRPLKAGDSYQIPAGAVHTAKSGPHGTKVLAVYVVKKGEPLATPAK